jgi:hypothetical protein
MGCAKRLRKNTRNRFGQERRDVSILVVVVEILNQRLAGFKALFVGFVQLPFHESENVGK